MISDNNTDYFSYIVPNKSQEVLKEAFIDTNQEPYKPYCLFLITEYIEHHLIYNQRERCRLTTTKEICKAIKHMEENKLF